MEIGSIIALSVVCALCVALIVALVYQQRRIGKANAVHAEDQAQILSLSQQNTQWQTRCQVAEKLLDEQKAGRIAQQDELSHRDEIMRAQFRNLANDILEEKTKLFRQTNRESMEVLLKPLGDNLKDFRQRIESIYSSENVQRGELKAEIKNLMDLNHLITEETTNLTNALKGNSKVQGDWGEMILSTILENSNLVEGIHYTTQQNLKDAAGNNLRPDVILSLPEGKKIVIDSKVSLTAFVKYTSADDPLQREAALGEHLRSVRAHVDELGAKRYQELLDSPDFVIMFIANEPAFLTALQQDNRIWSDAYNRKVIISSPTNLFALLKIVDDLWKRDAQSRNTIAIANEGAGLLDKFATLAETLTDVGKNIDRASESYQRAMGQLVNGRGNLVARTERLRKLGVKANKSLPQNMIDTAEQADTHDPDDWSDNSKDTETKNN